MMELRFEGTNIRVKIERRNDDLDLNVFNDDGETLDRCIISRELLFLQLTQWRRLYAE